ncbi:MAG: MFS transporter [Rickettsiales bacterium]|nr:MFS transporter [Rickettsiales bacterium]
MDFGARFAAWRSAAAVYRDKRVLVITFLGISSGFPLGILGDPVTAWLQESGLSKTSIGLFALVGLPYAFKFLWAPAFDRLSIPIVTDALGRRRGWIIVSQIALLACVLSLGFIELPGDIFLAAAVTLGVAFTSASQDIVIDAYRVEILEERQLGAGAATVVFGYRVGQVGSGTAGLIVASTFGWTAAFMTMGAVALIGIIAILLNPEPKADLSSSGEDTMMTGLKDSVVAPLADFFARPGCLLIIGIIVLYKLGDSVLSVMQTPFFLELEFTKPEIAGIKKGVGFSAIIVGGFLGGIMVAGLGTLRSLFACGILQALSNLIFVYQALVGHDLTVLTITVTAENLATGMGSTAFVAYLSSLCNQSYTATQYALLTSVMGGARTMLSASAGWFADHMNWVSFFLLTTVAALPALLLIWFLMRHYPAQRCQTKDAAHAPDKSY